MDNLDNVVFIDAINAANAALAVLFDRARGGTLTATEEADLMDTPLPPGFIPIRDATRSDFEEMLRSLAAIQARARAQLGYGPRE